MAANDIVFYSAMVSVFFFLCSDGTSEGSDSEVRTVNHEQSIHKEHGTTETSSLHIRLE